MGVNGIPFLVGHAGRIVLVAGFSLSAAAGAYGFEVTAEQREACTPDAFRLCSSEIPDVDRVAACMKAKEAGLSPRCRAVFQTGSLERVLPPQQGRAQGTPSTYAGHREPHTRSRYAHNREPHAPRYPASAREAASTPRHRAWMRSEEEARIEQQRACASGDVAPEMCGMSEDPPPPYPPPYFPPYPLPMDGFLGAPEIFPAPEDFGTEDQPEEDDSGPYGE